MPDRTLALKYTRHDRHQSNYLLNSMCVSLKATEIKNHKETKMLSYHKPILSQI